jgi:hypothetical protein
MNRVAEPTAKQAVAVVTAYFWPERLGCAPYMTDLANHLVGHGHAVDVFTAEPHYPRKIAGSVPICGVTIRWTGS